MKSYRLERLAVVLRNGALAGVVLTLWSWSGNLELWVVILAFALTCILAASSIVAAILFYADEVRRAAIHGWDQARKERTAGVQPH